MILSSTSEQQSEFANHKIENSECWFGKQLIPFWNNLNTFWNIIKFQHRSVLVQVQWLTGPAMTWFLFMKNRDPSFEYCDWHELKSSLSKQFKIQNIGGFIM